MQQSPLYSEVKKAERSLLARFGKLGYMHHSQVPLVTERDPTVLFTGSITNVLKHALLGGSLPEPGYMASQHVLRTQNLKRVGTPHETLIHSSYFPAFGTLSGPQSWDTLARAAVEFFDEDLGALERLVVRGDSAHVDLLEFWSSSEGRPPLELDACDAKVYTHVYGEEGIGGRNVNFSFPTSTGLQDFGNLILIEREGVPIAVELALGLSTMLCRLHDQVHPVRFSPLSQFMEIESDLEVGFADCVTAGIAVLREGVRPVVTNRGRLLRKYLQTANVLRLRLGMSLDRLREVLTAYEQAMHGRSLPVADSLTDYFGEHERLLADGVRVEKMNRALSKFL